MPLDLTRDIVARAGDAPERELLRKAGIHPLEPGEVQFVAANDLEAAHPNAAVALNQGLWPGIRRPPTVEGRGDETASASREPWVDANGYWIGYLRALYPRRPPVLGYAPNLGERVVPFDSLELALIEAWIAGGNYILALEPRYREALLAKDPKAWQAWTQLGATARWLQKQVALFRQPTLPLITALVEPGGRTSELANLLYRRNASPRLERADRPPMPSPERCPVLVAADIRPPQPEIRKRILAHAQAGASVVTAAAPRNAWWTEAALKPIRSEPDRDFYALGRGQVVAYKNPVADPSEFALDVIDVLTHKRRAVRVWNAPAVIALATQGVLHAVNYGAPIDKENELQARIQGIFTKATLLRPEAEPLELKPARRGATTEVILPEVNRLAVVVFS